MSSYFLAGLFFFIAHFQKKFHQDDGIRDWHAINGAQAARFLIHLFANRQIINECHSSKSFILPHQ